MVATLQDAVEIAEKSRQSTVLLVMEDSNQQQLSMGSGFFVRENEIATNLHVVKGAKSGYVIRVGHEAKYEVEGIVAVDYKHDLIVLKISESNASALSLGNSEDVKVGEQVYAVGSPQGLPGTFSEGIVSSVRDWEGVKLLQITAPISSGSSGGPVLNSAGQVIGVSVASFDSGQNLNFAIPSSYLRTLLKGANTHTLKFDELNESNGEKSVYNIDVNTSDNVVGVHFAWTSTRIMGHYSFSIHNKLCNSIKNVSCLVIFYADNGLPIETEYVTIPGPIAGKLSKRTENLGRFFADEVRNLTKKTEIRVLDFRLSD